MPATPDFVVACRDCEMHCETDALADALAFGVQHPRHTNHAVSWERCELVEDVTTIPRRTRWRVRCDDCDTTRRFADEARARRYASEHETYAGHRPNDPVEVTIADVHALGVNDVAAVVTHCFDRAERVDVVPTDAVLTAFETAGVPRTWASRKLALVVARTDVYRSADGFLAR